MVGWGGVGWGGRTAAQAVHEDRDGLRSASAPCQALRNKTLGQHPSTAGLMAASRTAMPALQPEPRACLGRKEGQPAADCIGQLFQHHAALPRAERHRCCRPKEPRGVKFLAGPHGSSQGAARGNEGSGWRGPQTSRLSLRCRRRVRPWARQSGDQRGAGLATVCFTPAECLGSASGTGAAGQRPGGASAGFSHLSI